jgi:hypothetical protein
VAAPTGDVRRRHVADGLVVPVDEGRFCVAIALTAIALCLVGVTTNVVYATSGRSADRFQRFLDVNGEGNLPTWYSVVLLATSAAAVACVAAHHRHRGVGDAAAWWLLAAIVAIMSLDEMVSLHEAAGHVLDERADIPVLGKYAWIAPGAAAAAVAGRVLLRAVHSLGVDVRRRLLHAGGLFVAAALGIEVLEALLLNDGRNYLGDGMHVLTGAQECLEMLAVVLFLRAMLEELRTTPQPAPTTQLSFW